MKGSTGQVVENPLFKIAARADELAIKQYTALTKGEGEFIRRLVGSR